jgi:hypothetical protein
VLFARSRVARRLLVVLSALLVVPLGAAHAAPAGGGQAKPAAFAAKGLSTAAASGVNAAGDPAADARVVVGVIDDGFNPLHDFFAVDETSVTPDVLAEFGIGADQIIDVSHTGDFWERLDRIEDDLQQIQRGVPYWFRGTNVIGISFQNGNHLRPDGNGGTHGIGTTASVLKANPEAVVVAVMGINSASERWTLTHPAVDIVTTSYGPPGSPPLGRHLSNTYEGVVELGKLHFGAVDNSPALSPFDSTGGPWWSIGISGYEEGDTEGRQLLSGSLPDFVGDFTQSLPYCRNCTEGERSVSGTSFATPTSAGVMSKVVLEARRAAGHTGGIVTEDVDVPLMVAGEDLQLTGWELRRILEEAAAIPTADEYDPGAGGVFGLTSAPVLPVAEAAQIGWGLVTADPERGVIDEMLNAIGVGDGPAERTKSAETCTIMTVNIEARQSYWDNLALFSDSMGAGQDPYINC